MINPIIFTRTRTEAKLLLVLLMSVAVVVAAATGCEYSGGAEVAVTHGLLRW
jgi:hypothetical protein